MFLNKIAKVAAREGLKIKQLLERKGGKLKSRLQENKGNQSQKDVTPLKGSRGESCICAGRWIKGDTNGSNQSYYC